MIRTFRQYLHFFINDNSQYGDISRIVNADKEFPANEASGEDICKYMQSSLLYDKHFFACSELLRRYNIMKANNPDENK